MPEKDGSNRPGKRAPHEMERDRALVADYKLKGLTNPQVAAELNNRPGITYTLSAETIRRDYDHNIKVWTEKALETTGVDLEMQKARLALVEAEAWAAWERSKDDAEQIREIQKLKDIMDENGVVKDSVLVVESLERLVKGQVGNERYLAIVLDCVEKRAKLGGQYVTKMHLKADIKEEKTVTYKMFEGVNPMQWDDPSIEVIGGVIHKNGKPMQIIDGQPIPMETEDD